MAEYAPTTIAIIPNTRNAGSESADSDP